MSGDSEQAPRKSDLIESINAYRRAAIEQGNCPRCKHGIRHHGDHGCFHIQFNYKRPGPDPVCSCRKPRYQL